MCPSLSPLWPSQPQRQGSSASVRRVMGAGLRPATRPLWSSTAICAGAAVCTEYSFNWDVGLTRKRRPGHLLQPCASQPFPQQRARYPYMRAPSATSTDGELPAYTIIYVLQCSWPRSLMRCRATNGAGGSGCGSGHGPQYTVRIHTSLTWRRVWSTPP